MTKELAERAAALAHATPRGPVWDRAAGFIACALAVPVVCDRKPRSHDRDGLLPGSRRGYRLRFVSERSKRVVIIGAGPGGLCMAIRFEQAGYRDVTLLEKGKGVGGTWYHNRYPGCECDIPSHLYSFSFEPKPDWSKPYATQPEILAYMEHVAEKYDVLRRCRFETEVRKATWDEEAALWHLHTASGESIEADVVVSAVGMFNEIAWPDIEGRETFQGTSWHSARWRWDHDLTGETVAVIGSAASAVQFVPEIVESCEQLYLYQRTANWVLPKLDTPFTLDQIEAFRADPEMLRGTRETIFKEVDAGCTFSDTIRVAEFESHGLAAIENVEDPETREKLRPQHPFGCKRPLLSNRYYPAFNRPNLELVTEGIERITADGITTVDGTHRRVDTILYATGFATTKYVSAIDVTGRHGVRIDDAWKDGARAYLGIVTPGFPNLFMLYGPNTNNGSILYMLECQVDYALRHVERLTEENLRWIDVREDATERYNQELQETMSGVQAWSFGCTGYYRAPGGRIVTQWPDSMKAFQEQTAANIDDRSVFEVSTL